MTDGNLRPDERPASLKPLGPGGCRIEEIVRPRFLETRTEEEDDAAADCPHDT